MRHRQGTQITRSESYFLRTSLKHNTSPISLHSGDIATLISKVERGGKEEATRRILQYVEETDDAVNKVIRRRSKLQKSPPDFSDGLHVLNPAAPTLPHSHPCSTIGAKELNFRVRDGNGCDLLAIATEIYLYIKLHDNAYRLYRYVENKAR